MSLESRLKALEEAAAVVPDANGPPDNEFIGPPHFQYTLPELPDTATPEQRQLVAEVCAMDAAIVGAIPNIQPAGVDRQP
jgi:hypothetical protein